MKNDYIFNTYNELNKEFEVHVMFVGNQYQFKLTKRLDGTKPSKVTLADVATRLADVVVKLTDVMDRLDKIDKRIDVIEQRLNNLEQNFDTRFNALEKRIDNLVAKNNLVE